MESAGTTPIKKRDSDPAADIVHRAEVKAILAALGKTKWNRRKAADLVGISYSSLRRRIAKYKIGKQ